MQNEIKTLLVLFKTHLDLGFTDFAENIRQQYIKKYIPAAIDTANKLKTGNGNAKLIWTTGSWLINEFLENADAENCMLMEKAINNGDICWHGLPFTTHTEGMDPELFKAGLSLFHNLDLRFGKKTIAAKMTDVPGHTIAMLPYLIDAGIEFLHIGVNPASTPPDVPPLFRWQTGEGKTITVMYENDYGKFTKLGNTGTAIYFAHTGDNHGPSSTKDISSLFAKLQKEYPCAEIKAANLNDVAIALRPITAGLPVITDEIGDTWIHGIGTDPGKVSMYRSLLRYRTAIENKELRDKINYALLPVCEHTWGLDEKTHLNNHDVFKMDAFEAAYASQKPFIKMEDSWEEQRSYVYNAINLLPENLKQEAGNKCSEYKRPLYSTAGMANDNCPFDLKTNNGWELRFDTDGSLMHLKKNGKIYANNYHRLGQCFFEQFSCREYERFERQYITNPFDWALEDFGKIGMDAAVRQYAEYRPQLTNLYAKENLYLLHMAFAEDSAKKYGCPAKAELAITFEDNSINFDFAWFEKKASRTAQAMWYGFSPMCSGLQINKMDAWLNPQNVVNNGNHSLHAINRGVRYNCMAISSLDAPLAGIGTPSLLNFHNSIPSTDAGIFFNLYNNIWGTNFPMWYEEDARFRFKIELI